MKKTIFAAVLLALAIGLPAALSAQTPNSPNDFDIANSRHGGVKITKYKGTRSNVVIPATIDGMRVTELGEESFAFVNGLRSDGTYVLTGIVQITSVVFPNTLIEIGKNAFDKQQLTSVSFPSSLRIIEHAAFNANKLTSVVIPNGVTYIGWAAFSGYSAGGENNITSIVIPPSLANFDKNLGFRDAFPHMFLTRITLPANVQDGNLLDRFGDDLLGNGGRGGDIIGPFHPAYVGNGRRAGTYVWTGRIWRVE